MPPRSNLFQDVVAIIHRHMAAQAAVEESAMLKHRLTGQEREVDVTISSQVAGHEVIVSVEATARGRAADVTWVEQQVAKHEYLPTSKLVLVSEAGFTPDARELAQANSAVPIEPNDLTDEDPVFQIVNRLRSIWPKTLSLTVHHFRLLVRADDGEEAPLKTEETDPVFLADGTEFTTVTRLIDECIDANMGKIMDQIGLGKISEDTEGPLVLAAGPPGVSVDGERQEQLYLREAPGDSGSRMYPITGIQVVGDASIRVTEVSLEHGRLGEIYYSKGQGRLLNRDALFVITETEAGGRLTIRTRALPDG